jgi:hypothetical protein
LPLFIGNVTIQRGWTSVDAKVRGKSYRFINAHTEAFHPGVEYAQSAELLQGPANTTMPVILTGDLNTDAENSGASYLLFLNAGFVDTGDLAHPADPGYTWPLFIESPDIFTPPSQRLDLFSYAVLLPPRMRMWLAKIRYSISRPQACVRQITRRSPQIWCCSRNNKKSCCAGQQRSFSTVRSLLYRSTKAELRLRIGGFYARSEI